MRVCVTRTRFLGTRETVPTALLLSSSHHYLPGIVSSVQLHCRFSMTFISPVCPHSMQAHRLRRGALSWPTGHASPPAGADQLRRRPHTTHLPHTPNGLRSRATRLSRVTCEALSHSSDRVLASVVTSADNESEAQVLGAPSLPYQGVSTKYT